jgi:large subunit ribosomal protein L25
MIAQSTATKEQISLAARARSKIAPEKIRKAEFIPGVVYGHNLKSENLEVPTREFEKVFRKAGESTIINLNLAGAPARSVIIHDVQKHYLSGKPMHVDFYAVSMTEKMKATVPLEFVGVSKAIKENGAVLVQVINELQVECLPADLPHAITVDISGLNDFNDVVHIRDLKISERVHVFASMEDVVAKAAAPRDVEAELAAPIDIGDVSKVEGVADKVKEGAEGIEGAEGSAGKETAGKAPAAGAAAKPEKASK